MLYIPERDPALGDIMALAFSPDGRLLASTGNRGRVTLWDVQHGVERRVLLEGGPYPIPSVAFSPDGQLVAVVELGLPPQDVQVFDTETGALRARQPGLPLASPLAFSPDGRALAVGGTDDSVRLLGPATARPLRALAVAARWSRSLAFSPDGRWLAHAAGYEDLRVLDLTDPSSWRTRLEPDRQP
jgi:WD40 repeat protein